MNCLRCGKDTGVIDTRITEMNSMRRRRVCLNKKCGHRFTTYEEACKVQNVKGKHNKHIWEKSKELQAKQARREVIKQLLKDGGMGRLLDIT